MRLNFLVEDPGVSRPSIEESSYSLRRVVSYVDVSHIGEIHMVVHVKPEASTSLFSILIQLTLVLASFVVK
jgi:hypothetical protein